MDTKTFRDLRPGDLIKHKADPRTFVVTENQGNRIAAVATVDRTNPPEWELVRKAEGGA